MLLADPGAARPPGVTAVCPSAPPRFPSCAGPPAPRPSASPSPFSADAASPMFLRPGLRRRFPSILCAPRDSCTHAVASFTPPFTSFTPPFATRPPSQEDHCLLDGTPPAATDRDANKTRTEASATPAPRWLSGQAPRPAGPS